MTITEEESNYIFYKPLKEDIGRIATVSYALPYILFTKHTNYSPQQI
jgi:hypothetical protein